MEKPLALKLSPNNLDEVIGQTHLIGEGKVLSNLAKNNKIFSMILYGNPGIGKTSIASAIVNDINCPYRFLNATINNKHDFDIVVEEARMYDGIVLIMDEIHQLMVPGRSGALKDVYIDSLGIATGVIGMMIIIKIISKTKKNKVAKN